MLDGGFGLMEAYFIAITPERIHVGASGDLNKHWVLDRESGRIVATSPVGDRVFATTMFVYASGFRNGSVSDGEYAVSRMDHSGGNETEILVSPDPLATFAASPTRVFFQLGLGDFEIWYVDDGMTDAQFLLDVGNQPMYWALHDESRLIVQDAQGPSIIALDLDALVFEPLVAPPQPALRLAATSEHLFAGTEGSMLRVYKDDLRLESLDDTGITQAIAADDEAVFWVTESRGAQHLRTATANDGKIETIPIEDGPAEITNLAVTSDALYIVRGIVDGNAGSVWRLARP